MAYCYQLVDSIRAHKLGTKAEVAAGFTVLCRRQLPLFCAALLTFSSLPCAGGSYW